MRRIRRWVPAHTLTINLSAAQPLVISVFVAKGSNISVPIDAISTIGDDGGSQILNVTSPNITTTSGTDLLIGFAKPSVSEAWTPGSGYTAQDGASSPFLGAESGLAVTAGTYNAAFTISSPATWQAVVVAAKPSASMLNLSWTASTDNVGVTGYLLERCQGAVCSNFAQIATPLGTNFTDTGLSASTSYTYRVRASDAAGNLSNYSNILTATTGGQPLPAPTVSSLAPTTGPSTGGTAVTITGTNFVAGATVTFGGTAATGVTVVSNTSITATTPAHAAGAVSVVVRNPDSQSATLSNGFTYNPPPTVTSVAPGSGAVGGGTAVTITGTNFVAGGTVTFGGTAATGVTVVNSTSITATTPAHAAGAVNVVVTNPDTQSGPLANGFTYTVSNPAPTVSSLMPTSGPSTGGTAVTITGTNFVAGATVTFGGTGATGVTVVSSTSITATTSAHAAGVVNVVVTNPDTQSATLSNGYTYLGPAPTLTSLTPTSGPSTGGTAVTITGTNFVAGATVTFGGTAATGVTVVSTPAITATTPAHAAGAVSVVVRNPDSQSATLSNGFTYNPPPTVTSVAPGSGAVGGGTAVTITGTNFVAGAPSPSGAPRRRVSRW